MTSETPISTRLENLLPTIQIGAGRPGEPRKKSINRYSDADGALDETTASLIDGGEISPSSFISDVARGEGNGATADIFTLTITDLSAEATSSALDVMPTLITSFSSNVTIAEGATVEIDGPSAQPVTFTGTTGTLVLEDSLAFTGQVAGLAGSDAIDLADVNYGIQTQVTYLGTTTGGTLTITDGVHTASIALEGNYLSSHWNLSSDGNGGTVVVDPVPTNAWQTLKIGAGGFLSGIDVAPDGTMVVRTDTYGAYIWNGSQWQQLVTSTSMPAAFVAPGNNDGVYEIQIASSNSSVMYMMYLGDVFKSTNKGTTWTLTNFTNAPDNANDSYRWDGQKMAIDPNNPNVVYVGTQQNGLFVTQDGGVTWQKVSAVPLALKDSSGGNPGITGILFDPALGVTGGKTNTIFASSYGNGVYESTDAGATWTHLSGGPSDVEYAAVSSTGAYYVTSSNSSQLWRYMNGAWTELLSSNPYWLHSVAINPLNPSEIVVQGSVGNPNVSYDGGATWTGWGATNQMNSTDIPWLPSVGNQMYPGGLVFNPLVPNELVSSGGIGVWNTILPQNWTANTPVVWNSQSAGIEQLVANQVIVPLSGHPVVASWDRAFFYVSDPNSYPTSFGPVAGAFAAGWSLDYASSNPNFVVGIADWWGTEESGYSTNGGQTWNLFPTMPAFAGKTIGGTIAASSPTDIVWAPADGFQPYYTVNGGISWSPVNLPGVTDWSGFDWAYYLNAKTVTADRVLANTFYLYYAGQGVYKSTDGGADWTQVFSGQISPTSYYSSELEAVPSEASNLFFTGGPTGDLTEPFMRSTDGGATWKAVSNVNEVTVFGFGAPATPGGYPSIYIAGYVNSVYGIWQSNDNANSWTQIGDYPVGSLDQIKTISGDPNIYGQVYVGFQGSGYAYLPAAGTTTTTTVVDAGTTTTTTVVDQAPVVTAINATLTHNQNVAASTLFTATDPDGQTITTYALKDVTGNGHFLVNGVVQATNVEIDLTAAQLAQTTYQSGSGSDQISIRASDGTLWSAWQTATVTAPVDQAPVVTVSNTTVTSNQSIAASSLFTVTDPDGDAIITYALKDLTGNGHFVVNGVVQATNVEIDLPAAQLAQTTYQSGSGSDQLSIRASDGTLWSAWQTATVTAPLDQALVAMPVNQAPVVTASNIWMARHQSIAASSLFTASDPDGDTITTYALEDPTGKGYFVVNGVVQASNTEIDLTAAQLAQTTYQSGSGGGGWGSEQLSIRASDGTLWSAWQTVTVTVVAPNEKAPVVTASDLTTLVAQTFAASSLFAVSDPNGDPIVTYALKDVTGSGYFVVNGVVQASNTEIDLTAAQLAQTTFIAGSGTDQLSVRASDGFLWSNWQSFTANVSPTPVINADATLEIASPYPGTVTFASTTGTLKLDNATSFAGTVAGFAGQDTLDLADINFATIQNPTFNGTSTGGVLTVTDGSHTASITLLGNYTTSTFNVSSDGHGGTFVVDPPATSPVLSPSDPAAPVTNALDQPVVTSPGMATVSTETGAPPPSIGPTTKDNAGLLSEVPDTTDCEVAQSKNHQRHDAALTSPPIGSKSYAIEPSFLSLSFDSSLMIAPGESVVAIPSDDAQHNVIVLLSQYTAAGFQARDDAGAMVSPATIASTNEAVLALFAQPVEKPAG